MFSPTSLAAASSSPTLRQTEVLTLLLRLEAVIVAAAAAVPKANAFVLLGVKEPHHGVVLAAALVLAEETAVWMEKGQGDYCGAVNIQHFRLIPLRNCTGLSPVLSTINFLPSRQPIVCFSSSV